MKFNLKLLTVMVAAGGIAALVGGGGAKAYVDTIYKYSTPKTGYMVLSAPSFMPAGSTTTWYNDGVRFSSPNGCFVAPVHLPHGSKMTMVSYWYNRSSADPLTVEFVRAKLSDDSRIQIFLDAPTDSSGTRKIRNVQITNPAAQIVDNAHYQYVLTVCVRNSTDQFMTARVAYSYTTAGD